jgi:hypothetical protein
LSRSETDQKSIMIIDSDYYYAINVYSVSYNQTIDFDANSIIWIFATTAIVCNMIIPSDMLTSNTKTQKSVALRSDLEIDLKQASTIYLDNLTH